MADFSRVTPSMRIDDRRGARSSNPTTRNILQLLLSDNPGLVEPSWVGNFVANPDVDGVLAPQLAVPGLFGTAANPASPWLPYTGGVVPVENPSELPAGLYSQDIGGDRGIIQGGVGTNVLAGGSAADALQNSQPAYRLFPQPETIYQSRTPEIPLPPTNYRSTMPDYQSQMPTLNAPLPILPEMSPEPRRSPMSFMGGVGTDTLRGGINPANPDRLTDDMPPGSPLIQLAANYMNPSNAGGNPWNSGFYERNIVTIMAPGGARFEVHREAAPAFQGFVNELATSGYTIRPEDSGGYMLRNKRGGSSTSQHGYGNAIDINWSTNPFQRELKTDMPENVSDIARKWGLEWGGDWRGKKDAMHFEWTGVPVMPGVGALRNEEDIKAAQEMLAAQGLYTGEIDGEAGPLTRQALAAYAGTPEGATAVASAAPAAGGVSPDLLTLMAPTGESLVPASLTPVMGYAPDLPPVASFEEAMAYQPPFVDEMNGTLAGGTAEDVLARGPLLRPRTPPPPLGQMTDTMNAAPRSAADVLAAGPRMRPGMASPMTAMEPPALPAPETAAPPSGSVIVQPGDNPWTIASRILGPGATNPQIAAKAQEIVTANNVNPRRLQPGQSLVVPGYQEPPPPIPPMPNTTATGAGELPPIPRLRPVNQMPPVPPVSEQDRLDAINRMRGQGLEGIGRPNENDPWPDWFNDRRRMVAESQLAEQARDWQRAFERGVNVPVQMNLPGEGVTFGNYTHDGPRGAPPALPSPPPATPYDPLSSIQAPASPFKAGPVPAQPMVDRRPLLERGWQYFWSGDDLIDDLGWTRPNPDYSKDQSRIPLDIAEPRIKDDALPQPPQPPQPVVTQSWLGELLWPTPPRMPGDAVAPAIVKEDLGPSEMWSQPLSGQWMTPPPWEFRGYDPLTSMRAPPARPIMPPPAVISEPVVPGARDFSVAADTGPILVPPGMQSVVNPAGPMSTTRSPMWTGAAMADDMFGAPQVPMMMAQDGINSVFGAPPAQAEVPNLAIPFADVPGVADAGWTNRAASAFPTPPASPRPLAPTNWGQPFMPSPTEAPPLPSVPGVTFLSPEDSATAGQPGTFPSGTVAPPVPAAPAFARQYDTPPAATGPSVRSAVTSPPPRNIGAGAEREKKDFAARLLGTLFGGALGGPIGAGIGGAIGGGGLFGGGFGFGTPATFTASASGTSPGGTWWKTGESTALGGSGALQYPHSQNGSTLTVVTDPWTGTYYGPTYS